MSNNSLIEQQGNQELEIEGKILKLTNLGKVYWPEEGFTKGELLNYYLHASEFILPYLRDRPESLHRYPNGIKGKNFYQKNVDHQFPDWIKTADIYSEGGDKIITYMIINDLPSLLYAVNLGCIDLNPWSSRLGTLDNPDYLLVDLDPETIPFDYVISTALAVQKILDDLKIVSYPKTSGATGIHIYIPMQAKYSYEQVRQFAELLVGLVHQEVPEYTSLVRTVKERRGKVYLDWLQNSWGQTLAAPYCVRPKQGATVSTPLEWNEVQKGLSPGDFTIKNAMSRFKNKGDIFMGVLNSGVIIEEVLSKLKHV
ncbi:MAG: non-homologous end-joining DNA ligase [Patescibacteria group bacterium]